MHTSIAAITAHAERIGILKERMRITYLLLEIGFTSQSTAEQNGILINTKNHLLDQINKGDNFDAK